MNTNYEVRGIINYRFVACRNPIKTIKKIFNLEKVLRDICANRFEAKEAEKIKKLLTAKEFFLKILQKENRVVRRQIYRGRHFRATPLFEGEQPLRSEDLSLENFALAISQPHDCGVHLFLIAKRLGCKKILELGTGFGVSATYFLAALEFHDGFLDTIEKLPVYLYNKNYHNMEFSLFSYFSSQSYKIWYGDSKAIMPKLLRRKRYDLIFLDASHLVPDVGFQIQLAMSSFSSGGVLIIDDIDWSEPMQALWQEVKKRKDVGYTAEVNHNLLPRLGIALKI